jgi:hypothetical protein
MPIALDHFLERREAVERHVNGRRRDAGGKRGGSEVLQPRVERSLLGVSSRSCIDRRKHGDERAGDSQRQSHREKRPRRVNSTMANSQLKMSDRLEGP